MKTRPRASPRNRGITAGGDFHPALRVLVCFNVLAAGVKGRGGKFPRFWRFAGREDAFWGECSPRRRRLAAVFCGDACAWEETCGEGGARARGSGTEDKRKHRKRRRGSREARESVNGSGRQSGDGAESAAGAAAGGAAVQTRSDVHTEAHGVAKAQRLREYGRRARGSTSPDFVAAKHGTVNAEGTDPVGAGGKLQREAQDHAFLPPCRLPLSPSGFWGQSSSFSLPLASPGCALFSPLSPAVLRLAAFCRFSLRSHAQDFRQARLALF